MSKLSPAAQAVLNAYRDAPIDDELTAAAVVRAAALHVYSDEYETCGGASYALMIDVDDLLAIASELESKWLATPQVTTNDLEAQ
jgi:hypothetical protein